MGRIQILGFRSQKPLKMIVAGIVYLFLAFLLIGSITAAIAAVYPTETDRTVSVISALIKFLAFGLPVFAANLKINWSRLDNIEMGAVIIAALMVSAILIITVMPIVEGYHTELYREIISQRKS